MCPSAHRQPAEDTALEQERYRQECPGARAQQVVAQTALIGALHCDVRDLDRLAGQYFAYRISHKNQPIEGLIAATYLEARKALTQSR